VYDGAWFSRKSPADSMIEREFRLSSRIRLTIMQRGAFRAVDLDQAVVHSGATMADHPQMPAEACNRRDRAGTVDGMNQRARLMA
jgi:hypothetical protein